MQLSATTPENVDYVLERLKAEGTVKIVDAETGETLIELRKETIYVMGRNVILPAIMMLKP
jgi:hypothetical protein